MDTIEPPKIQIERKVKQARSHFDVAIEKVFFHEGNYVDDPFDPGGATKYGISLRWLSGLGLDFDNDGDVDKHDIQRMTRAQAKDLYYQKWWKPYPYNRIDDIEISSKLFDMAVNMGTKQAVKLLQLSLNEFHMRDVIKIDGVLGNRTVMVINKLYDDNDILHFMRLLRDNQGDFYKSLIKKNPHLKKFEKGWIRRAQA